MKWVIQTSFVGDCILSLPFINELLESQDDENILLITQPGIQKQIMELALERSLNKGGGRVSLEVLDKRGKDKSLLSAYKKAKEWRKQWGEVSDVYCLQRSFRSALLAYFSEAEERIGFGSGAASFMYSKAVARSWNRGVHEIEKNLDLLRLNYEIPEWSRRLKPPSFLAASGDQRPERKNDRVALALGSPWPTKRWPTRHASDLVKKWTEQGVEVLLMGDPSAEDLAAEVLRGNDSLLVQNKVGKTGAREWVDLIDSCGLLVSADSASLHVASDLGVPVLGLFGPTIPEFGFTPWREGSRVLQVADLSCRPCGIHGHKQCPLKHHRCMEDIGPERVFTESRDLLVDPKSKKG